MLDQENFMHEVYVWRDRQAGVSVVYDDEQQKYSYNAYCVEKKLLKELFTCEYDYLDDALDVVNKEFGNWTKESFDKTGCSSCAAK